MKTIKVSTDVCGTNCLFWIRTSGKTSCSSRISFLLWFAITRFTIRYFLFVPSFSLPAFWELRNASINSGQSKCSSSSKGLSVSVNLFHFRKYLTFPFTTCQSSSFSTTNSSDSASLNFLSCLFYFFLIFFYIRGTVPSDPLRAGRGNIVGEGHDQSLLSGGFSCFAHTFIKPSAMYWG